MEMNENETLGRFICTVYNLGFHLSRHSVFGRDHSAFSARVDSLFDLGLDLVSLAAFCWGPRADNK